MKPKTIHPIVENINKIVKDRNLSKISFAELCNIPEPKWNKISNGVQELSLWELSIIADALKLSICDIVTYPEVYVRNTEGGERISVTFEVSPDKRDILLNLVTKQQQ